MGTQAQSGDSWPKVPCLLGLQCDDQDSLGMYKRSLLKVNRLVECQVNPACVL